MKYPDAGIAASSTSKLEVTNVLQQTMYTFNKHVVKFILLPSHTPWQVSSLAQYNTVQYNAMQILLGVAPLQGCKM